MMHPEYTTENTTSEQQSPFRNRANRVYTLLIAFSNFIVSLWQGFINYFWPVQKQTINYIPPEFEILPLERSSNPEIEIAPLLQRQFTIPNLDTPIPMAELTIPPLNYEQQQARENARYVPLVPFLQNNNQAFFNTTPIVVNQRRPQCNNPTSVFRSWHGSNRFNASNREINQQEVAELNSKQNATKLAHLPEVIIDERFICGISLDIMTHPVYDIDAPNQKMDYQSILEWFKTNRNNPFNRRTLNLDNLVYDEALKKEIDEFVTQTLDSANHHPCSSI